MKCSAPEACGVGRSFRARPRRGRDGLGGCRSRGLRKQHAARPAPNWHRLEVNDGACQIPTIYRIHTLTNGDAAMWASRLTIDDSLREAKFLLGGGASLVWIDYKEGNPVLPADQIRARVA